MNTSTLSFDKDDLSALEAISQAQQIAFAPFVFQATVCLRDFGILAYLDQQGKQGASLHAIMQAVHHDEYTVRLLLDVALTQRIVYQQEENYFLAKVGYFLLHNEMTRVNMDFSQDVCYQGLFALKESFEAGQPKGLAVFDPAWKTIYPHLSQLPHPAQDSWFKFDHFYSSASFGAAAKVIKQYEPALIYDVGGNTGKWSLVCCDVMPQVRMCVLDLPEQIALLKENLQDHPHKDRISGHPINILDDQPLPTQADMWWMSQFLDCFSAQQVVDILKRIAQALKPNAKVAILETFWDCQTFSAAAACLTAYSLYFTAMANGNSRFYGLSEFAKLIEKAGLKIEKEVHNLGVGHSLLICSKA